MADLNGNLVVKGYGQVKNFRADNRAADPTDPQAGYVWFNTVDKVYRGYDGAKVIVLATGDDISGINAKIAQFITSVGLQPDGTFVVPAGANYLTGAVSVIDAISKLDAQTKTEADAIAAEVTRATGAEGTLTTNLAAEVTRATAAEGTLTTDLAAEVTRAEAAEKVVSDGLAAEVTRATAAEGTLTTNLAAEVTRATGIEGGIDTRLLAVEGSYIKKDGTVAFTGPQSFGGNVVSGVADPAADGDATNKKYVDTKVGALGNAFNYVGTVSGGADVASAFDLSTLPNGGKDTGDYYKVALAGYFKGNASATPFHAELHDGLVKNIEVDGWDVLAHADTVVIGTANYIAVAGTIDTGFTVDVDAAFKSRVSTVETGLSDEVTRATTAEGTLTTNLAAEVTRATAAEQVVSDGLAAEVTRATAAEGTLTTNLAAEVTRAEAAEKVVSDGLAAEVTRATGIEGGLQTEVDAVETAVGLNADGTLPAYTGNYTAGAASVNAALSAIDTQLKAVSDGANGSSFLYTSTGASTTHVVAHNLGRKYVQLVAVDSDDNLLLVDNVHFDSNNQLTITLASAQTLKVYVSR